MSGAVIENHEKFSQNRFKSFYLLICHYGFLWKKRNINGPLETIISQYLLLLYGAVFFSIKSSIHLDSCYFPALFLKKLFEHYDECYLVKVLRRYSRNHQKYFDFVYGIKSKNTQQCLILKVNLQPYFQVSLSIPDFPPYLLLKD